MSGFVWRFCKGTEEDVIVAIESIRVLDLAPSRDSRPPRLDEWLGTRGYAKAYARLGTTCYGFAPVKFDPTHEVNFSKMYHGHDERVPVEGLKWGLRVLFEAVSGFCSRDHKTY